MLTDNEETRMALYRAWGNALTSGTAWSALIAKANELAADTIRVVRCPEVEEVGALQDPVELHGLEANVIVVWDEARRVDGARSTLACYASRELGSLTRWCLASDLARDPATTKWHERERRVVRRWTAETVPQPGTNYVPLFDQGWGGVSRANMDAELCATVWNRRDCYVGYVPLPTVERGA